MKNKGKMKNRKARKAKILPHLLPLLAYLWKAIKRKRVQKTVVSISEISKTMRCTATALSCSLMAVNTSEDS